MKKAGTTTLHRWLSTHPSIFLPSKKELHGFSHGPLEEKAFQRYLGHFEGSESYDARGQASPTYAYLPGVLERAAHWLGHDTKIVLIIRNPVMRAHSHYRMEIRHGCEHLNFPDAIKRWHRERRDNYYYRHHSYIGLSLYTSQIGKACSIFGNQNVYLLKLESLKTNSLSELNALINFLIPSGERLNSIPEPAGEGSTVPRISWLNTTFSRINDRIRRNLSPRPLLKLNERPSRHPPLTPEEYSTARDILLNEDPDLLHYYPNSLEIGLRLDPNKDPRLRHSNFWNSGARHHSEGGRKTDRKISYPSNKKTGILCSY